MIIMMMMIIIITIIVIIIIIGKYMQVLQLRHAISFEILGLNLLQNKGLLFLFENLLKAY